ncbi:MAG: hypothetical protein OEM51_01715 [Gammaproteobacteria bacterium]|nr:hypothetical protein [Gammaproteobacteria bacterium]
MTRTINVRELRAQLELDHPILMRPWTTDPDTVRDMVARGLDRRDHKRPGPDRRKDEKWD